ncbi:alpha/beta fold hydrolase [Sphingomonas sp. LB-2]|uniref:alpha/beta hydrolase n=1 Tax=Sphingomonas caeni TaxID=2984949 RepID=UPI002230DC19|nr:alpha/beta fold hydrolase [Sphingomonas caeni]MCW3849122.1 alpha/beta fold hydrolase [Sphingomonas caeni]
MIAMRKWLIRLAVFVLAGLALSWVMGSAMVRPEVSHPAAAMPPAHDLMIDSPDGLLIAATYWPGRTPQSPGILLLHGNGASRDQVAANAAWLAGQGYAVLTIDFRGHGESSQRPRSFGWFESRDTAAAFAWLKKTQRGAKVGVVGISLGGAAALLGENGALAADALVLQAVYPDIRRAVRNRLRASGGVIASYGLEPLLSYQSLPRYGVWPGRIAPIAALRRFHGPVLIIGGAEDRFTPPAETREMFAAAPGPKALWLVPGLDHGQVSGMDDALYRERLRNFFAARLGMP